MPWGALASPSPRQPSQPAAANLHPTQSCRILPRDRFELNSFHCLSSFRPRPLQLWPLVTTNKEMNKKANLVLIEITQGDLLPAALQRSTGEGSGETSTRGGKGPGETS